MKMESSKKTTIPLPVVISKEGDWFVAECPLLDIATQGKDEEEVKENILDLIEDYFHDPDTVKPNIETMMNTSISVVNVPVKVEQHGRKTAATKSE